jgi:hypothetical protein
MHGENNIKLINAQQARLINTCKNTKGKLHRINAAIWFDKVCRQGQLTPKYIHIRVNGNYRQSSNTKGALGGNCNHY